MNLDELIRLALVEDVGPGDVTTEACVPGDLQGKARVVAREPAVVAGQEAAGRVFALLGARYTPAAADGTSVERGGLVGTAEGPVRALLTAERTALNFLMRLSGIATWTRVHVQAARGAFAVVDTRKTTPLHRTLEKAAVRAGGGRNHRFALYDGVLVKDNHIVAAQGIAEAVRRVRARTHHLLKVQVEVEGRDQALEALAAGADALLLDNMDDDALQALAKELAGRVVLEASGGMTPERIARLATLEVPIDFVSVGGLVHRARWVDFALDLEA
ncbi:MAG: carboxylating nicotinate-nucleotide diphosphorylase [Deltaproteobacteria bacterium]|nr:carboxylating nicotinate-nucleotide diphosphorylase [Deltaproteobacteria bacterium]